MERNYIRRLRVREDRMEYDDLLYMVENRIYRYLEGTEKIAEILETDLGWDMDKFDYTAIYELIFKGGDVADSNNLIIEQYLLEQHSLGNLRDMSTEDIYMEYLKWASKHDVMIYTKTEWDRIIRKKFNYVTETKYCGANVNMKRFFVPRT